MKGDTKVIEHLNKVLGNEMVAINQYFLHARMYKDWGLQELGEHEYHESIDEMKHADRLLECDLKLEHKAHVDLKEAVAHCETVADYVSRQLFVDIMESEEEHIDWLETQLGLIEKVGLQNYLQTAMHTVKPA